MSSTTINNWVSEVEAPNNSSQENVENCLEEDRAVALESSGGSSELEALHLKASTVTFTGVPSPQPSDPIPAQQATSSIPENGSVPKLLEDPGKNLD